MNEKTLAQLALEFWRASGERTLARLDSLVSELGQSYQYSVDALISRRLARADVRSWELFGRDR